MVLGGMDARLRWTKKWRRCGHKVGRSRPTGNCDWISNGTGHRHSGAGGEKKRKFLEEFLELTTVTGIQRVEIVQFGRLCSKPVAHVMTWAYDVHWTAEFDIANRNIVYARMPTDFNDLRLMYKIAMLTLAATKASVERGFSKLAYGPATRTSCDQRCHKNVSSVCCWHQLRRT